MPRLGLTSGHGECSFMGSSDSPLGCQCYRAPSHRINTKLSETARQMIQLRVSLGLSISLRVQNRVMFTSICEKIEPKSPTPTHNMFVSFSTASYSRKYSCLLTPKSPTPTHNMFVSFSTASYSRKYSCLLTIGHLLRVIRFRMRGRFQMVSVSNSYGHQWAHRFHYF